MKTLNKLKNALLFLLPKKAKSKSQTTSTVKFETRNKYGTFITNQSNSILFLINAEENENLFI